jgi:archaeal type IV pilus assembly protein PilA
MKANQKFLRNDDDAVSPVIAVILMVAITVVLAATVYVWVSGFGSSSGTPAKTISLSSNGALTADNKTYAVASATSGMKWSDISFTMNGASMSYLQAHDTGSTYCIATSGSSCAASAPTSVIAAGQLLTVHTTGLSGQTLRVLDSQANSVILTLVVG